MTSFSVVTIKQLFGLSMNQCAFPGCEEALVDPDWFGVKGEICHICAASPNGPRYDASMTEDDRYAFENLILLCPTHHVVIDRLEPHLYTVEVLRKMKEKMERSAMSGERRMIEKLGVDYVDLAATQFIVASNRYYSLSPLPPMTRPANLRGRVGGAVNLEAKSEMRVGVPSVAVNRSVVDDTASTSGLEATVKASMGGTSEEVTSAGSHGASLEHEVIRGALDELNFSDSATVTREDGMPTGGHHASDESLNEDSAKRD